MWTAIAAGIAGAVFGALMGWVAAFYTTRQKVVDMEDRVKELTAQVGNLEAQFVLVGACRSCKELWVAKLDAYHVAAKKAAEAAEKAAETAERIAATAIKGLAEKIDLLAITVGSRARRLPRRSPGSIYRDNKS
jgi:hypothetical protein